MDVLVRHRFESRLCPLLTSCAAFCKLTFLLQVSPSGKAWRGGPNGVTGEKFPNIDPALTPGSGVRLGGGLSPREALGDALRRETLRISATPQGPKGTEQLLLEPLAWDPD